MTSPKSLQFSVRNMSCASCVGRVESVIADVAGVTDTTVNLASQKIRVTASDPETAKTLGVALRDAGYPAVQDIVTLSLQNLSCASCVGRAERALESVPGVLTADVNLATETAKVTTLEGAVTSVDLVAAARDAGYPGSVLSGGPTGDTARKSAEIRQLGRKTLVAAIFALPVVLIEMGGHAVPALHHYLAQVIGLQNSYVLQFLLTSVVLFGPGRGFFTKGFPALARGTPDMNALVALGTSAAFAFSTTSTFAPWILPDGTANVYFEAAAVIVVLVLLGRWLEARAKGRTGHAIRKLIGLQPKTARIRRGDISEDAPIELIQLGDVIEARPGERIAVDGAVISGESYVDEAMLTGEPIPVAKTIGATVTAGTINGTGAIQYRADKIGADTMLAQIIAMVEQAQSAKLPIQGLVDRITAWFVPAVLGIAGLTFLVWIVFGPDPSLGLAIVASVSVLIIACPCAMGLATPTSIIVGTGRAAEMGILFRQGDALQRLQDVGAIAFDKTGTLTQGRPDVSGFAVAEGFDGDDVLRLVASVEQRSEHPIAGAILRYADENGVIVDVAKEFRATTGMGAQANVAGQTVLIGADRFLAKEGVDLGPLEAIGDHFAKSGKTPFYVAVEHRAAAVIAVSDPVKESSVAAIKALKNKGIKVVMLTGDNRRTARAIALDLGIDHVEAEILPKGKTDAIEALRQSGQKVAFVGDGINDAPALAVADVGVAIGTGTDVAIETADVVLVSGDLKGAVTSIEISRRTMQNIRQNLFWAFGYNTLLIPVAAGVFYPLSGTLLSPMLAAGAMAFSSVLVLGNALRLGWMHS